MRLRAGIGSISLGSSTGLGFKPEARFSSGLGWIIVGRECERSNVPARQKSVVGARVRQLHPGHRRDSLPSFR
jgi:hypothetical protein